MQELFGNRTTLKSTSEHTVISGQYGLARAECQEQGVSDTNCKPHSALQANCSAEKNHGPSLQLPFAATGFPLQQSRSIETSGEAHRDMVPQAREFGAQSNKKKGQVCKRTSSQARMSATGQPNEDDAIIPPKSQETKAPQ